MGLTSAKEKNIFKFYTWILRQTPLVLDEHVQAFWELKKVPSPPCFNIVVFVNIEKINVF